VPDSYCGTNIVAHEFFHAIHGVALKSMAPHVWLAIERAALRAVEEGIYQHHPGAPDDGCDSDFTQVRIPQAWEGLPTNRAVQP
jgi:hypothetical protein